VGPNPIIRRCRICAALAAGMFLIVFGSVRGREVRADSQTPAHEQPVSAEPLVIQGRITIIQGALVTVKTPDAFPGGPGVHAQFVVAGPAFRVDVSRARVLLPDGKQADTRPLAVGEEVLMVLSRPHAPATPGNLNQTYSASTVERIAHGDRIITH